MKLTVNGQPREVAASRKLDDLLQDLGITPETVVIELNRSIIPPEHVAATQLQDGDRLELIQFVGGG